MLFVYLATSTVVYIYYFPIFYICLYCHIQFVCSLYIWPLALLYIFTTFLYFIYAYTYRYCCVHIVCSLYIWPLALLYIFTTFQYFMVSCPTIRCQYWRLTNNKYTFQYNRDDCHRGAHSEKNILSIFDQPTFYDEYPKLMNSEDQFYSD